MADRKHICRNSQILSLKSSLIFFLSREAVQLANVQKVEHSEDFFEGNEIEEMAGSKVVPAISNEFPSISSR